MNPEQRQRQRDELLTMTERLIAEYSGLIPAGKVMRTVARCYQAHLLHNDARDLIVASVEHASRSRLAAILPAHRVA